MADGPFDPAFSERAKKEAMARVDDAANTEWKRCYDECLLWVCKYRRAFTTDDVELRRWRRYSNVYTHERRAIGPRMMNAMRAGWCTPTDMTELSSEKTNHRRRKTIWRSLIYQGPAPLDEAALTAGQLAVAQLRALLLNRKPPKPK